MRYLLLPLILLLGSAWGYEYYKGGLLRPETLNYTYFNFESQGQNVKMAYIYKRAHNHNSKTILLLHGKNFSARYWMETMDFLNNKGFSVIAVDQLGFGRSSQPLSYQFTFQQLAANTKLLLDSLHIPEVIVLGHSMGGMLATRFALMYPGRCIKLILEDPIGLEDWKRLVPYSTVDQETKTELMRTRKELKEYMTKSYFHNTWKPAYETLLDENEEHLKSKDFKAYAKNMALTTDMIFTQPVCEEFKDLKIPTSLIIGQLDRTTIGKEKATPEVAERLGNYPVLGKETAGKIQNCQLLELDSIGHVPHIENFKLFCANLTSALQGL